MPALEYPKLNRVQRMAVFLIVIGQESAANLVRNFADGELEAVCREVAKVPMVTDDMRKAALEEFANLVGVGFSCARGGAAYVRGTLGLARGEQRAAYLLARVAPGSSDGDGPVISQFEGMDARQVFSLLKGEQPQTVAFLLSQLEISQAAEIFRMLDAEKRAEALERLGEMESTSPETVSRIALQLNKRAAPLNAPGASAARPSGGTIFVASLLKSLDKETSRSLLAVLQDRNAALSETIRKKLFSFDDLAGLTPADIQRILREVEPADLAAALKGPRGETMLTKFTASMSKRAAEGLRDEIEMMPPVRAKDQEAAQDRVLAVLRRLEEQGEITLDQGDGANAG